MKAPDGTTYTTTCTAAHCEIQRATTYQVDLVDPHYAHDRKQERQSYCKVERLKHAACYRAFSREETIQKLLAADGIVSTAGNMPAMSRDQAEQLIDEISRK